MNEKKIVPCLMSYMIAYESHICFCIYSFGIFGAILLCFHVPASALNFLCYWMWYQSVCLPQTMFPVAVTILIQLEDVLFLPNHSQKSRYVLEDRSWCLGWFWKRKMHLVAESYKTGCTMADCSDHWTMEVHLQTLQVKTRHCILWSGSTLLPQILQLFL